MEQRQDFTQDRIKITCGKTDNKLTYRIQTNKSMFKTIKNRKEDSRSQLSISEIFFRVKENNPKETVFPVIIEKHCFSQ
jgi:hypothetical protein